MASRPLCDECYAENDGFYIWLVCQKPCTTCSSHQNSWVKMDVNNPTKNVSIGIDPYPYMFHTKILILVFMQLKV